MPATATVWRRCGDVSSFRNGVSAASRPGFVECVDRRWVQKEAGVQLVVLLPSSVGGSPHACIYILSYGPWFHDLRYFVSL